MTRHLRKLITSTCGTAAIEFALVLPLFLLMMVGILSYGFYFGAAHSTAQLAADAARASVAGLTDQQRSDLAQQHIARLASHYVLLDADHITSTAAMLADDPTVFQVVVRYDSRDLPIWHFAGLLPLPDTVIERTALIKRGGY